MENRLGDRTRTGGWLGLRRKFDLCVVEAQAEQ